MVFGDLMYKLFEQVTSFGTYFDAATPIVHCAPHGAYSNFEPIKLVRPMRDCKRAVNLPCALSLLRRLQWFIIMNSNMNLELFKFIFMNKNKGEVYFIRGFNFYSDYIFV